MKNKERIPDTGVVKSCTDKLKQRGDRHKYLKYI